MPGKREPRERFVEDAQRLTNLAVKAIRRLQPLVKAATESEYRNINDGLCDELHRLNEARRQKPADQQVDVFAQREMFHGERTPNVPVTQEPQS